VAHFAELDSNNVVLRVVVVGNEDTADANGVEKESIGQAHLEKILGGTWKQTSYNANMRKHYAGKGFTYDSSRDAFIAPKPFESWVLNDETCVWEAPSAMPTDGGIYLWNEEEVTWDLQDVDLNVSLTGVQASAIASSTFTIEPTDIDVSLESSSLTTSLSFSANSVSIT
jgi:hypothetical protein